MTILELKNFLVLARLLHFGKASEACHVSPSALTRSVQRMEEEVGQALFLRDKRSVHLTFAGEKLREYASEVVSGWENFLLEVNDDDHVGGLLSIYASVTAVYSLLPELLESYRAAYPEVQVDLRTGSAEESIQQVMSGEVDLSIAALPEHSYPGVEFMPLVETDLVFITRSGNAECVDFATTPLVVPRGGLSRRRLDQWFRDRGIEPNIKTEVSGNEGILAMVRLGSGVGIVPELVLERSPFRNDVQKIKKAPKLAPYVVGFCTSQKNLRKPNIAAFWALAEKEPRARG